MRRRRLLQGLVGLSVIPVAGCLGSGSGDGSDDSGTTSPTATERDATATATEPDPTATATATEPDPTATATATEPDPTATEDPVAGKISTVRNRQTKAAQSLQTSVDSFLSGGANEVDTSKATGHLDDAKRVLDGLGPDETVSRLQQANRWLRALASSIDVFNRGYVQLLKSISQSKKDNIDNATSLADRATKTFAKAKQALAKVAKAGKKLGDTPYPQENEQAFSAAATVLTKMYKTAGAQQAFSSGFSDEVSARTWQTNGFVRYNNGQYRKAESRFADARRFYTSAAKSYNKARKRAPSEAQSVFDSSLCRAKSLYSAMQHFETAAVAAQNGRTTLAEQEFRAGRKKQDYDCSTR